MKLSIIFVTRNREIELTRAIESCLENKIEDMEIVIIDNNSSDGTKEVVFSLLDGKCEFQYYHSSVNLGVSGGRNKAVCLAKGEYIFSLDDDAIIGTDNLFEKICTKMDNNRNIIIGAVEILEPETGKYLKEKIYYTKSNDFEGLCALSFIGAAHIIRKDFFKNKSLYPEKLFFGSEELYASLSVLKEKKIIAYFDDLQVLHLPSKISRVTGDDRLFNFILNTFIIRKLCYPSLIHPILYLLFRLRLRKYKLLNYKTKKELKKVYEERYRKEEINRMTIGTFLAIMKDVGLLILVWLIE